MCPQVYDGHMKSYVFVDVDKYTTSYLTMVFFSKLLCRFYVFELNTKKKKIKIIINAPYLPDRSYLILYFIQYVKLIHQINSIHAFKCGKMCCLLSCKAWYRM